MLRDAAVGPSSGGDTVVRCRATPRNRLWLTICRKVDGQTGRQEDPALCGQLVPLPSQEAGAAAKLDEELPFTEPIGLHHLTEGLIGWQQKRKRRGQIIFGPVKIQLFSICQALMVHQAGRRVSLMSHFNAKFREAQVALGYGTSAELM